jgi:beta-N-acetylhexosaminidase
MSVGPHDELHTLADRVLMPCFDGLTAPDWLRRRMSRSLGAVCLFGRNIHTDEQVRRLTDELRAENPAVVIAMDEEAGDVTRLDAGRGSPYPGNAALGRVDDVHVTRTIGEVVGARLAAVGVNVNFAPCADVSGDPANPVISVRSFGNDVALVARHTEAFVVGHQAAGVAACAKHFPGHGGTDADSHLRLAVLRADLPRLRTDALPPFIAAVDAGVASVMPGHLLAPAVDDLPASVSHRWLTEILRGDLAFDGAIITDALEMRALAGRYSFAESAVLALSAGADLLCLGGDTRPEAELDAIVAGIVAAVRDGRLPETRLVDAAARATALAARFRPGQSRPTVDPGLSEAVARRALDVAGPLPSWQEPVLVVRCVDRPNIAVGQVPWGPAAVEPALHHLDLTADLGVQTEQIAAAGTVLVVTRDRHRNPWMSQHLSEIRALRPDAVLLEMGTTGVRGAAAPAIASYGATMANTSAALAELRGLPV